MVSYAAATPEEYLAQLEGERKEALTRLHAVIMKALPPGFEAATGYGMMGYVVPFSLYPAGYHCPPVQPLPFMGLASQKGHISVYHMGMYIDPVLHGWFVAEYPRHSTKKLDMGKSCFRIRKAADVPYDLIGELAGKMTVDQWVALYESKLKPSEAKR